VILNVLSPLYWRDQVSFKLIGKHVDHDHKKLEMKEITEKIRKNSSYIVVVFRKCKDVC
jgi:hypothetical protein